MGIYRWHILLSLCIFLTSMLSCQSDDQQASEGKSVERYLSKLPLVVCDPMVGTDLSAEESWQANSNKGIKGRLFEGPVGIEQFSDLVDPITQQATEGKAVEMEAMVVMNNIDVPTRSFSEGFKIGKERYVLGSVGQILTEDFGLLLQTRLTAGDLDPGYYEFSLLADDGAVMKIRTQGNDYDTTLLRADFVSSTRMSCSDKLVRISASSALPAQFHYFQGPRYHIAFVLMARKVADLSASDQLLLDNPQQDQECNRFGNSRFFDSNNNSRPTKHYQGLLDRGWRVVSENSFLLPHDDDVNYCLEGTNIIIDRDHCYREDILNIDSQHFELMFSDFEAIDFSTLSVLSADQFLSEEMILVDFANERVKLQALPSSALRLTYCLK